VTDSRYVAEMITLIEDEFPVHLSSCEISEDGLGSLRAVALFAASEQLFAVGGSPKVQTGFADR